MVPELWNNNLQERPRPFVLPPIYPITDKGLAGRLNHFSIIEELVRGGAEFLQIRDKTTPLPEFLPDLIRCAEFASKKGIPLIINDRWDLVLSSGAAGVHLGQEDLPPEAARRILGKDKIIGFSTSSLMQIRNSRNLPIQYVGFGPVFATSTKPDASPEVGLSLLTQACTESAVPVVAIGGIGIAQVRATLNAGAASVAVISALMQSADLAREMERFLEEARGK
jgi:thiamine-phosphate pyrophosphorylase